MRAARSVTWEQFADNVTRRGLHDWMLGECQNYAVLLEEVFEGVGPHKGRRSVRHARARIFRLLVECKMKSYTEVAEMFGVHPRVVSWSVEGTQGYLPGEPIQMRHKRCASTRVVNLVVDREEFMKR